MEYEGVLFAVDSHTNGLAGRKYKNAKEAILDDSWQPWDDARIKRAFAFGNGTMDDFKRFCKSNKIWVLTPENFMAILEKASASYQKNAHTFIHEILHMN